MRSSSCRQQVTDFIKEKKLESMLYGGLIQLFQGKSDNFCRPVFDIPDIGYPARVEFWFMGDQ